MPAILRTGTPMADWRSFKFSHTISGLTMTEGYIYQIEDTVGVLLLPIQYGSQGEKLAKTIAYDEDDPNEGVLFYHAEKIMVRKLIQTGLVFNVGDKVFWPGAQGAPVNPYHRSGAYWIGICVRAATWDDEYVMIDLKGDKATMTDPI